VTPYSPERRTALVFSGTGVHGAYHAGVLRALQEAGVKIDVVAGHGMGAGAAALAAVDGASRLWERDGVWGGSDAARLYRWKRHIRQAGWFLAVLAGIACFPLVFLAAGLVVYPFGLLVQVVGLDGSGALLAAYSQWLLTIFTGQNLPIVLPRLAMVVLMALLALLLTATLLEHRRAPARRRAASGWWWRLIEGPIDVTAARAAFAHVIGQLVGVAPGGKAVSLAALGPRYTSVLAENLGQPGFRELLLVTTDLDTRQDLVGALLREPYRGAFIAPRQGRERDAEVLDLAGPDGAHALALLGAALTPPLACDPEMLTFGPDRFWRGETHRLCDRPGALARVMVELEEAGVTQVIVVTAVAPTAAPHRLRAPHLDPRSRLGEFMITGEAAALREAMVLARLHFQAAYLVSPAHNPVGPFDVAGTYDQASDRWRNVTELFEGGYEDAYRQFVEPVVGASGEHLARGSTRKTRPTTAPADGPWLFDDTDAPDEEGG
jgi:hypothetical protein